MAAFLDNEAAGGSSGAVLISRAGCTLYQGSFGADRGVDADSRFWIGSLTKTITAAAILRLEQDGRLSLQDPVARFFPDAPEDKRSITVRQLLTHTSGLPHQYSADGLSDRTSAAAAILSLPLAGPPGGLRYSNDGYSLLAVILEIASGEPYEQFVRRWIFAPAGMNDSGFWPGPQDRSSFAPIAAAPSGAASLANWGYRGASGIYSTAADLHRFSQAYFDGRIINLSNVSAATSAQVRNEEPSYGYGWFVLPGENGPQIFHSGAETGLQHFAWLRYFPERQTTIVLLSNAPLDRASPTSRRVIEEVFRVFPATSAQAPTPGTQGCNVQGRPGQS